MHQTTYTNKGGNHNKTGIVRKYYFSLETVTEVPSNQPILNCMESNGINDAIHASKTVKKMNSVQNKVNAPRESSPALPE